MLYALLSSISVILAVIAVGVAVASMISAVRLSSTNLRHMLRSSFSEMQAEEEQVEAARNLWKRRFGESILIFLGCLAGSALLMLIRDALRN